MDVPIKKLVLKDDGAGVMSMAFVDQPAIMVDWVAFSADKEIKLSVQDEMQGIVFGPALIPDLLIPRINKLTGEKFAVFMDAPTIEAIALKFMQESRQNSINEAHDASKMFEGITIYESFIANDKRSKMPVGFESLPLGTWFITAKVNNEEMLSKIKTGEVKGFSIEGFFAEEPINVIDSQQLEAVISEILTQN